MLARHRDPHIIPLEIWDLLLDGLPLYRIPRDRKFGAALARAVQSLISGHAVRESPSPYPHECRAIEQVVLVGGAAHPIVQTCPHVPATPFIKIIKSPELCAEQGGHALLARLGFCSKAERHGLVVDLGQSQLKISGLHRRVLPRDFTAIPISSRPIVEKDSVGRPALVTWVADALRHAAAESPPPAIVFALPCEVAPDGAPGTCSYPWPAGDPILPDILAAADLTATPTFVLNDAELAALGVAARGPVTRTTLVLTLGFGVGAALLLIKRP